MILHSRAQAQSGDQGYAASNLPRLVYRTWLGYSILLVVGSYTNQFRNDSLAHQTRHASNQTLQPLVKIEISLNLTPSQSVLDTQYLYHYCNMQDKQFHPLNDEWSFWYAIRGKEAKDAEHYNQNLKELGQVCSVEQFFQYYCYLKRPSQMPHNHKLLFFRKGCRPMWEDWKDGGCWIWMSNKKDQQTLLDRKWESLLLACIGEQLDSSEVVGVVLSKRDKFTLLQVWLSTRNENIKFKVGEKLNQLLNLENSDLKFYFKDHNISLKQHSTMRGSEKYTFVSTPMDHPLDVPKEIEEEVQGFSLN